MVENFPIFYFKSEKRIPLEVTHKCPRRVAGHFVIHFDVQPKFPDYSIMFTFQIDYKQLYIYFLPQITLAK